MTLEEHYYREELGYPRQLGKLLAQEKPHLAHFLAGKEGDPDVECLMEAFTFMPGSLRQEFEGEFPEFTHRLIRMLWANYLRPAPAMTVITCEPKTDQLKVPIQICHNELIRSRSEEPSLTAQKVLPDNHGKIISFVICHFTLARNIWLQPLHILDARNTSSLRESIINIGFAADNNISPAMLDLSKIAFWLDNEDDYIRHQLCLWFCECLMDAELIAGKYHLPLPDLWLEAAGFNNRDALLPWPKNAYGGCRVLQEYFCYLETFFFFRLRDVTPLLDDFPINAFTLRLHLSRPLPADAELRQDSLRLHCAPAIDLFTHYTKPIRPDGRIAEYPLRASRRHPDAYDIFQVSTVTSRIRVSGAEIGLGSQARV